jgi:hypothetical protein
MFVARDQQTGGVDLPETRSRFYESLLEELIINRRARGDGLPSGRQRLRHARQAVLGPVCLEHLLNREEAPNSIPRARFIDAITQARYGGNNAEKALLDLSIDTGLFTEERSGETERFMHLTLCEFLAAVEVVETGDVGWARLFALFGEQENFWESRLTEVVAFACGIAGRAQRQRILADLAQTKARQIILKAIIEAQAYDEVIAYDAIMAECQYLGARAPKDWDAEWFSRLRTVVGVLRDAHAGYSAKLGTTSVAELPTSSGFLLSLIERYNAEEALLETLARQDAETAVSIASETGRRDLMDHVAAAADDFAVLEGILGKCEAGDSAWRAALCERALTNRNSARILRSTEARELISKPRHGSRQWAGSGVLGDSVYGFILDDFLGDRDSWSDGMVVFLEKMTKIRPPTFGRLAFLRPFSVAGLLTAAVLVLGSVLSIVQALAGAPLKSHTSHSLTASAGFLALFIGLASAATIFVASRHLNLILMSGNIANAESDEKHEAGVLRKPESPVIQQNIRLTASSGIIVRMDRARALSEILNLSSYSFRIMDRYNNSVHVSRLYRFYSLFFCWLPPSELNCLLAARLHRREILGRIWTKGKMAPR